MRVFLTGATGFVGSHILPELLAAGHQVIGLTRSEAGAKTLVEAGAQVHRGTLDDLDSLRAGADQADAVIHTAFEHDFTNFIAMCEKDRRAVEALGSVLKGSNRPLIFTSGTGIGNPPDGSPALETVVNPGHANPRTATEVMAVQMAEDGVNISAVRLPQVHNTEKQGLITPMIAHARKTGVVAYAGEGRNRVSAAHVLDVAKLYVLALEHAMPNARYHAVAEEGIEMRHIAETMAAGLGLPTIGLAPEDLPAHFGWLAMFMTLNFAASSALTRQRLGWTPTGPGLIEDLQRMDYGSVAAH